MKKGQIILVKDEKGALVHQATLLEDVEDDDLKVAGNLVRIRWFIRGDIAHVRSENIVPFEEKLPPRKRTRPNPGSCLSPQKRPKQRITVPGASGADGLAARPQEKSAAVVTPTSAQGAENEQLVPGGDLLSDAEPEDDPELFPSEDNLLDDGEPEDDPELFPTEDNLLDDGESEDDPELFSTKDDLEPEDDLELFPDKQEEEENEQQRGDIASDNESTSEAGQANELKKESFPSAPPKHYSTKIPDAAVRSEGELVIYEESTDEFFLRWLFGGKLKIIKVGNVSMKSPPLEKQRKVAGEDCTLICSKLEKGASSHKFNGKDDQGMYVKAYYVSMSKNKVRKEMEKIANFQELSPTKVASRFELLVSPAARSKGKLKVPYQFKMDISEFEEIQENGNEGSGFIPKDIIQKLFGRKKEGALICAIQVRVVAPGLGIFKGTLVRKHGIKRVQLPLSLKKVNASLLKTRSQRWVYVDVIRTFPSTICERIECSLNPNLKDPTGEPSNALKAPPVSIRKMMLARGVPRDMLEDYCCSSTKSWDLHKHAWCAGVADPTGSLPHGTIFISGRGEESAQEQIFVTRSPNTEIDDSLLVESIRRRPNGMKTEDWKLLCSLHFGIVVFSCSQAGEKSLPEKLGGDLDGDQYFVCWDEDLVSSMTASSPSVVANDGGVDDIFGTEFVDSVNEKKKRGTVVRKDGEKYVVNFGHGDEKEYTRDEIMEGRAYPERIEAHRVKGGKTQVKIRWQGGGVEWRNLSELKKEIPDILARYAAENDLLHTNGWKGFSKTLPMVDSPGIAKIIGHKGSDKTLEVKILWEDGSSEWQRVQCKDDDLREEDPEVLVEYARANDLENKKGWKWVKRHLLKTKNSWFDRAQDVVANVSRLKELDMLTKRLSNEYKNIEDFRDPDKLMLGRAFKDSLDIGKHGGRVKLPVRLRDRVPASHWKYIYFSDE